MKENNYISDNQKQAKTKKKKKKSRIAEASRKQSQSLVQIMNGDFLTKGFVLNNLTYIFFVIFLMILMVSKGYYVHQLANDITKEEKAVGDITADYVETKAKLEELTRRTQMIEKLKPLGLKETINPTKVIRIKNDKKEK
ncbi:MAG TPA: FtsL-like putative cell division protein [Brumimicrobium sp.]|nr:FtsL-like putative cell division protein [Brumimicrobium sp.]